MTRITLDHTAIAKLNPVSARVEICDETGRCLGYFVPLSNPSLIERLSIPVFTEEELRRAADEPGGRPLEEILRELEQRA